YLGHVADDVSDRLAVGIEALRPVHHQEVGEGAATLLDGGDLRVCRVLRDRQEVVLPSRALLEQLLYPELAEPEEGGEVAQRRVDGGRGARGQGQREAGYARGHDLTIAVGAGAAGGRNHDRPETVLLRTHLELLTTDDLRLEEGGEENADDEGDREEGTH